MLRQIVLVVAMVLAGSFAHAQSADNGKAEARRHYDAGLAHFNLREYSDAINEFQAAYRILPDPVFLYNLGQSYRLANNPEQALYFYQTYLRTAPDAPNRGEVDDRIAALQKLITEKRNAQRPPDHALPPSETKTTTPESTAQIAGTPAQMTTASQSATDRVDHRPIYRRWWFWTITGVVVVGAAVGLGVGLGVQKGPTFNANLGTFGPNALTVRF